jgi:UDP-4-amino-4,6-dideoxy-N-acetyl-beta-L-altrosamine N-acetyltransferase
VGVIMTDDVLLRAVRASDKDLLFKWISNRELRLYNSAFLPISDAEHNNWFEEKLLQSKDKNSFFFIIEYKSAPIGSCQLSNVNWVYRSAELQIRIGDVDLHGCGYGTQAVRALVEFGFNDLNLNRIHLQVFETNSRAIHVYEKVGFSIEGVAKQGAYIDGQFADVCNMALLREGF